MILPADVTPLGWFSLGHVTRMAPALAQLALSLPLGPGLPSVSEAYGRAGCRLELNPDAA